MIGEYFPNVSCPNCVRANKSLENFTATALSTIHRRVSIEMQNKNDRRKETAMTVTMDQFNGEFTHITARDIREHDVILGGARSVATPPEISGGRVAVVTVTGPEIYDADTRVYVFRPAAGC